MPEEITDFKNLEQDNTAIPIQKSESINIDSSQAGLSQVKSLKAKPAKSLVSNAPSKQKSTSSNK